MRADEVRAILAGRKTQFRRAVKWPLLSKSDGTKQRALIEADAPLLVEILKENTKRHPHLQFRQLGAPGDRLWVREAWLIAHVNHIGKPIPKTRPDWMDSSGKYLMYAADGSCCQQIPGCKCGTVGRLPWRPSIHMPRWACRIILEVTGVRVERLQDISEADAKAEGYNSQSIMENPDAGRLWFRHLWQSINGPRSWDENPWVRVVEFRVIEGGAK